VKITEIRRLARDQGLDLYAGANFGCGEVELAGSRESAEYLAWLTSYRALDHTADLETDAEAIAAFEADWVLHEVWAAKFKPYSIMDYEHCHPGEDPQVMDSYVRLCRITLAEAEKYLADGTVPAGHELGEASPYCGAKRS
jgi:hypothetical protein